VWLVEEAKPVDHLMRWQALQEQHRRLPGTGDLSDGTTGEPRRRDEAPLQGALRDVRARTAKRGGDDRVADQDTPRAIRRTKSSALS
jgi:hypothetical protein